MHNNEWSLIGFTLISQLSVGLLLVLGLIHFFYNGSIINNTQWWKSIDFIILLGLVFAAIISLLHLGNPLNAPKSINNLSHSWVSREILMLGVLSLMMILLIVFKYIINSNKLLLDSMNIITVVIGLLFIYSMSRIYMIETIPSWNSLFTPLSFFMSVTLFLLIGLLYLNTKVGVIVPIPKMYFLFIVFLIAHLIVVLLNQNFLTGLDNGIEPVVFNSGLYFTFFIFRIVLITMAVVVLVVLYFSFKQTTLAQYLSLFLVLILLTQEAIGRYLFYQSFFRLGM